MNENILAQNLIDSQEYTLDDYGGDVKTYTDHLIELAKENNWFFDENNLRRWLYYYLHGGE